MLQGEALAVARAEAAFAVSALNSGIAAAVTQLSLQLPQVKFLLLDWYSLVLDIGESRGMGARPPGGRMVGAWMTGEA